MEGVGTGRHFTASLHLLVERIFSGMEASFLPCYENIVGFAYDVETHHCQDSIGGVVFSGAARIEEFHEGSCPPYDDVDQGEC